MNELTTGDVTLTGRIRDTCAELDPVPDNVLAAARAAFEAIRKQTLTAGGSHA